MSPAKKFLPVLIAAALVAAPCSWAKERTLDVKPGDVNVTVLRADANPVAAAAVKMLSVAGELVSAATTNAAGIANLGVLAQGTYRLDLGNAIVLPVHVTDAAQATSLQVVLPTQYQAGAPLVAVMTSVGLNLATGVAATIIAHVPAGVDTPSSDEIAAGVLSLVSPDEFNALSASDQIQLLSDVLVAAGVSP